VRIWLKVGILALALCAFVRVGLDAIGTWFIRDAEREWRNAVSSFSRQMCNERPSIFPVPATNCNAADLYTVVLSRVAPIAAADRAIIRHLEQQRDADPAVGLTLLGARCDDAGKIREAVACKQCEWGNRFSRDAQHESDGDLGAIRTLADCMLLTAAVDSRRGLPGRAAEEYVTLLAFGSDLARSDFITALSGMVVARMSTDALLNLITTSEHGAMDSSVLGGELGAIARGLSLGAGCARGDRLEVSRAAQLEATMYAASDRHGVRSWLEPSSFVAADRLFTIERLNRDMETAATDANSEQRLSVLEKARHLDSTVGKEGIATWQSVIAAREDLVRRVDLIRVTTALEQYWDAHRDYPLELSSLSRPDICAATLYTRAPDRQGYSLQVTPVSAAEGQQNSSGIQVNRRNTSFH
jgi:hypothetical protein